MPGRISQRAFRSLEFPINVVEASSVMLVAMSKGSRKISVVSKNHRFLQVLVALSQ